MEEKEVIKSKRKSILPLCIILPVIVLLLYVAWLVYIVNGYMHRYHHEMPFGAAFAKTFKMSSALTVHACFWAALLIVVIISIVLYVRWKKIELTVTTKRVYGKVAGGRRVDIPLDSISATATRGKHVIAVTSASGAIRFGWLANRDEIHSAISALLVDRQDRKERGNTVQAAPASSAEELRQYKQLLEDGVISQEEFDAKKKQLLGL